MHRGHRRIGGTRFAAVSGLLMVLVLAAPAIAAEVHAIEIDGDTNDVVVERGRTTTFTFLLSASGALRCVAGQTNPATASVTTEYTWTSAGMIDPGSASSDVDFWANPSCQVTWAGAPSPVPVTIAMSVDEDAPLGNYSFVPMIRTRTPFGSGDRLEDRVPTVVRFRVVPPAGDRVPPVVACDAPAGVAGDGGWYVSAVSVACSASDAGSGLADPADASFTLSTSGEGPARWTPDRVVADREGNATPAGPFGAYPVDLTDPVADLWPADGTMFTLGAIPGVGHACHDDVSGIASCVVTGAVDTSVLGPTVVRVTARDHAGRTTVTEHTYHVVYDVRGPWVTDPEATHRAGRALPLSWRIDGVDDPGSYAGVSAVPVECSTGAAAGASAGVPTVGSLRADAGTFAVNVKTDRTWHGCVLLSVELNDGSSHGLVLRFR